MRMIWSLLLCGLVGVAVCDATDEGGTPSVTANHGVTLEPGLYRLQLVFSPATDPEEMGKEFGNNFNGFKNLWIDSFCRSFASKDDAVRWAPVVMSARTNDDFKALLSLPLNWWSDFPVLTVADKTDILLPRTGFSKHFSFDGKTLKASGSLCPTVGLELEGTLADTNSISGTFKTQWVDMKTMKAQQSSLTGSFTIRRTGALPDGKGIDLPMRNRVRTESSPPAKS